MRTRRGEGAVRLFGGMADGLVIVAGVVTAAAASGPGAEVAVGRV